MEQSVSDSYKLSLFQTQKRNLGLPNSQVTWEDLNLSKDTGFIEPEISKQKMGIYNLYREGKTRLREASCASFRTN